MLEIPSPPFDRPNRIQTDFPESGIGYLGGDPEKNRTRTQQLLPIDEPRPFRDFLFKVFEPFFTTKSTGKGTGLGLSMVYGIVKQSNGHVSVYSEPGEGTTFKLYLPQCRTEAKNGNPTVMDVPKDHVCSETILVVEDDIDVRTILVNLLDGVGYEVLEANSAECALEQLRLTNRVNLLFTDVVLPGGLNGREKGVARKTREALAA